MVFWTGILIIFLTVCGIRTQALLAIPACLRHSIPAGIGLFIAFIGLQNSGLIVPHHQNFVQLGKVLTNNVLIFVVGLLVASLLAAFRIKAFLLLGIIAAWVSSLIIGVTRFEGVIDKPPDPSGPFMKMDLLTAITVANLPFLFTLFFMGMFDGLGTAIGILRQAGIDDKKVIGRALLVDGTATCVGAAFGTSNVTCYIESSAGVASGARGGLSSIVCGILFILCLFFYPAVKSIGGFAPITAPALFLAVSS